MKKDEGGYGYYARAWMHWELRRSWPWFEQFRKEFKVWWREKVRDAKAEYEETRCTKS